MNLKSVIHRFLAMLLILLFAGCATSLGTQNNPPQYDPRTGTYHKSYTTGELGSNFVKDLLGINKE